MTKYWNVEEVVLKDIYVKYHVLIQQHLNGKDMLMLSEVSRSFNKLAYGCDSCMHDYFVDFNVERMEDFEDLGVILNTKRRYRSFRFKCFDSKDLTGQLVKFIRIVGDRASTIELTDMNIPDDFEDIAGPLNSLRYFKLTAIRGEFKVVILQPFTRYERLTFESNLHPVKLKTFTESGIETHSLHFINCSFDLEHFNYFSGECTDFWIESNRKNEITDVCRVLGKSSEITSLLIKRTSSPGFFFKLNRVLNKELPKIVASIFTRRKQSKLFPSTSKNIETEKSFHYHRSSSKNLSSEESNDSCSTASSELTTFSKEIYKISLDIHDLTPHVIEKLSKSLPCLRNLTLLEFNSNLTTILFKNFKNLQTIKIVKLGKEETISRRFFMNETGSMDPVVRFPCNVVNLIVQHFGFYDSLMASMVSRVWNGAIGTTKSVAAKIVIKVDQYDLKSKRLELLRGSQRDYQNLEINAKNIESCTIKALEVVNIYSAVLVELSLIDFDLQKITNFKKRFTFPKLKALKLNRVNEKCCFLLLQNCSTITSFSMSSMPIVLYTVERLKTISSLKSLSLNDCNFDYFGTLKDVFIDSLNLNLEELELTFESGNSWITQNSPGFVNFSRMISIRNVKHFKASGIRGELLSQFLNHMFKLKTVEIKHFWEHDLEHKNLKSIKEKFELQLKTLAMAENIKWFEIFPSISTLSMKQAKYKSITENDKTFIKLLWPSSEKMILEGTYKFDKIILGVDDPIVMITEELHSLLFQHLNRQDVLNCSEVSKTWNKFCRQSNCCSTKTCLFIRNEDLREVKMEIQESDRKFSNLICNFYNPLAIKCFRNLKKLTLMFDVVQPFKFTELPLLETLIILRCPAKLYKADQVQDCFKVFAECEQLKFLEIYESITSENVSSIIKMLENNRNLKTLKIHQCSEFYRLFAEDISQNIHFNLTRLHYAIPEKFTISGSKFEEHFINFLIKNNSLKIIDMNHVSAKMMNTIFQHMKQIETIRYLRLSRFELIDLKTCTTLKEFMLPNTPALIDRPNDSFDFKPILKAAPNLELLYVESVTEDLVNVAARNLKKLKVLSCEKFDRRFTAKSYVDLKSDSSLDINRFIKIRKVNFKRVNGEERSYENLFGG